MKKTIQLVSVLTTVTLLLLTLTGCEVGPDYATPETQTPANWVGDEQTKSTANAAIEQTWWKNFNDPVLSQLIDKATADNLDLKIAEARIAEARAGVSAATATLLPSGNVKGTATREANMVAMPGGSSNPFAATLKQPYNIYQTGFDASWELDLFGGNRRAEEGAEAQMQAAEASRDDVRVSLLAEVARTYIAIRQYQAQLAIAEDQVASNKKTRNIEQQLFDAGQASRLALTQAEAALQQAKSQIPVITTQLTQAEFSLDTLLGTQPGETHKLVANQAPVPTADVNLVLAAPASVIAQRPDIRVAERKLAAATAQQGVAVAKFFPDISISGFFGALNTSTTNLISGSSKAWMAGGSVIWPILSYGTLSANLDSANAQQQEALATYQKSIINALSDVERSLTAYNEQGRFLQSITEEVEQTKHSRAIANERFQKGLTARLDVLEADRALNTKASNLVQAQASYAQNLVAVYKSLGGGWVTP